MRPRFSAWWYELRDGLWFLPAIMTAIAVALALLTVRLDQRLLLDRRGGVAWVFGGGAEGARGVLSAIAGTMVTVTALVFSITVVALQLASSQLTPRVLRSFMSDRGNQAVLGFFIGTFTYALLVLRAVRSPLEGAGGFVPALSVTVAIVLALVSVGLLIYYVHHAANSMRASVVIDRATRSTLDLIDRLFPEEIGSPVEPPTWLEAGPPGVVRATGSGYLQSVNGDALFDLAERRSLTMRLEPRIGEFVLPGAALASVWPAALDEELADAIRAALILGSERTLQADVELGIRQLADIATKALSPGLNDPTTATICVDRLGQALVRLAQRGEPDEVRAGGDGSVRLVLRRPPFERLVGVAFDQIRHFGAGDPTVAEHLVTTLGRMTALVPAGRRAPLAEQAGLVLVEARHRVSVPEDLARIERAASWALTDPALPIAGPPLTLSD